MSCLLDLASKRLKTVLIESILPYCWGNSASSQIFQNTKLLQNLRHMNLLLHVLVVLVQNPPTLTHLATARAVNLAVCHKNVPTVPLDVVTLLKVAPSFLPLKM